MRLELSEGALDYLAKQGYDPVYGARWEEGGGGGEVWCLMRLELSDGALDYLAKRGYDPVYGARCEGGGWER